MTSAKVILWASMLLAVLLLGVQLVRMGSWVGLAALLVLGLAWVWGNGRKITNPLLFLGVIGVAGYCAVFGPNRLLTLLAVIAALTSWDLACFLRRAGPVDADSAERLARLERRHLQKLLLVDLAGVAVGTLALEMRLSLSFTAGALLALACILGLAQSVQAYRRE